MRKRGRLSLDEIDDNIEDESDFTEELCAKEELARLRREIALLSKEYRECTVAYYYDELSCAEVSEKLGISLEMVKYYLFKTRKLLKEGFCMEREFGEKSFKPAPFKFNTIFSGSFNREYRNLFSRKLPGQILLSAYYTPMTTRELAIELGVASVYLEDEISLLEEYHLLTKTAAGKYQANLVIFTDDFTNEFYRKAEKFAVPALAEMFVQLREKLNQFRNLNDICGKLPDNRLLWGLLWPLMREGHKKSEKEYPELQEKDILYNGAAGINYGISNYENDNSCPGFAGYAGIDENYYASAADFSILPENNRYFENTDRMAFKEKIDQTVSGEIEPECMILTEAEEKRMFELLSEEAAMMAKLYDQLFSCSCQLMHIHAPKSVDAQIDRITFQTLFFRTVSFIGECAVKSGMLALPDFDGPAAIYVRENTNAAKASINEGIAM